MSETNRKIQFTLAILFVAYVFCYPVIANAQQEPELSLTDQQSDTTLNTSLLKYLLKNPSTWIQNNINKLNISTAIHPPSIDTVDIIEKLRKIDNSNGMIRRNLEFNNISLRNRQAGDLKNELMVEMMDLERLQKKVVQYNNYLLKEVSRTMSIQKEIKYFYTYADSSIVTIYKP